MAQVLGSKGQLNLKIGQVPVSRNPKFTGDLQSILNALHVLNSYLQILRDDLEGTDDMLPNESMRFTRVFFSTAGQSIAAGSIVSMYGGQVIKGVKDTLGSYHSGSMPGSAQSGARPYMDVYAQEFYVALTSAEPGQQIKVGVPPGILRLDGAACGETIFAASAYAVQVMIPGFPSQPYFAGRYPVGNGNLYKQAVAEASQGVMGFEEYTHFNSPSRRDEVVLHPIGICVAHNYVLINDYVSKRRVA